MSVKISIRGITLQTLSVPMQQFILQFQLVNGEVTMGVRPSLPEAVEVILGNNLAGECTKMMNDVDVILCDTCVLVRSVAPRLSLLSKISHAQLVTQRDDPRLKSLFAAVLPPEDVESAVMINLLKNSANVEWTPHCQKAFENVKLLLTAAPVLAMPQSGLPFEMQVDAG
ncbi:Gag-Pol polyprotein [Labeo rohita]|uniref:Gag-Pol polyprotein n=1 Tax=Labeo rohita TaxID=84645 RepID=A0ABQ8LP73_LABRO|nr:Gag-Pol polyprotein [Labeo rohita]